MPGTTSSLLLESEEFPFANHYPSIGELYDWFDTLEDEYPDLLLKINIGESWEGRDLYILKISNEVTIDQDEPEVLILGGLHAREWSGIQASCYLAWRLLTEYETDESIHWLLNNREVYIAPIVNPDGYVYDGDGEWDSDARGAGWRKNRNDSIPDDAVGVDLNRNWDIEWESGNSNPSADDYHGEAPFSEFETKALRDWILSKNIQSFQDIHSFAGTLLIPYCYTSDPSPHDDWYRATADRMTSVTSRMGDENSTYSYGQPHEEIGYSAPGGSIDWVYDEVGAQSYCFELDTGGSQLDPGKGFHPPEEDIMTINKDVDDSLIYQIRVADVDLGDGDTLLYPPVPYIVYGTVQCEQGYPITNNNVTVSNVDTSEHIWIHTDSNGYYELNLGTMTEYGHEDGDLFVLDTGTEEVEFHADDAWGERIDVTVSSGVVTEIPLDVGMNFISFNVDPHHQCLIDILEDPEHGISGEYESVTYYDASEDRWHSYVPGRADHFNDVDSWDRTVGIWLEVEHEVSLQVVGNQPSETVIDLYPGWNMVGYPGSGNTLPPEVDKIGVYDASAEYLISYIYEPWDHQMEPGKGYWIHNPTDSVIQWHVPP